MRVSALANHWRSIGRLWVCLSACLLFSLSPCRLFSQAPGPFTATDSVIDSPMYKIPDLPVPQVIPTFPKGALELWLRALERPEADLKIKAADAFALAQRRGFKEVDAAVASLVKALDLRDQHPGVRLALARALITMDARGAAPNLFRQLPAGGSDLRQLIEPALARWDYAPARALWLERLGDPAVTERSLVLAIQGLAAVREGKAADRLRALILAERLSGPLRLEAAAALAALRSDGLEVDAEKLAADAAPRGVPLRLAAATLLRQHRSARAIEILQRLGADPEPAVAAVASARLIEIDPELMVPSLARLLASPDSTLRSFAVAVLLKKPSAKHLGLLADRLDDVHPDVRGQARSALVALARTKEWHAPSIAQATRMLATEEWRALEQATIVLTLLDHKPTVKRLVELLDMSKHNRPEVFITAGWGLRKLNVPEMLPIVAGHVQQTYERLMSNKVNEPQLAIIDYQLSQLNQFIGQQKYAPADAALRLFVAKRSDRPMYEARAAAIWALGMIHEGQNVPPLATALVERFNDTSSIPPEDLRVRLMSALTLGRMRSKEALPSLQKYNPELEWTQEPVSNAGVWAVSQITGAVVPPPKTLRPELLNWFLVPN